MYTYINQDFRQDPEYILMGGEKVGEYKVDTPLQGQCYTPAMSIHQNCDIYNRQALQRAGVTCPKLLCDTVDGSHPPRCQTKELKDDSTLLGDFNSLGNPQGALASFTNIAYADSFSLGPAFAARRQLEGRTSSIEFDNMECLGYATLRFIYQSN